MNGCLREAVVSCVRDETYLVMRVLPDTIELILVNQDRTDLTPFLNTSPLWSVLPIINLLTQNNFVQTCLTQSGDVFQYYFQNKLKIEIYNQMWCGQSRSLRL